jgi:Zn-dependent protease
MGLLQLLVTNPLLFFMVAAVLLYSIIAHELAHGYAALLFGDDTAKRYGRLTLNPLPHLDPLGILMLLLAGFGWAKPVPVNYDALGNSRFALICVALAGCVTNILIAFIALIVSNLQLPLLSDVAAIVVRINIVLGAFNLIPIPPLDGSKVLMAFLPWQAQQSLARIEPYGMFILIFFLFTGLLNPVIAVLQHAIYGLAALLFGLFR